MPPIRAEMRAPMRGIVAEDTRRNRLLFAADTPSDHAVGDFGEVCSTLIELGRPNTEPHAPRGGGGGRPKSRLGSL
ncbi:hypothetical protein GCM10010452_07780 [Crossiella cryophila]